MIGPSPNPAIFSEQVTFVGNGTVGKDIGLNRTIVEYNWTSSVDDFLNANKTFTTAQLSATRQIIFLKVKDSAGRWSAAVDSLLYVQPIKCKHRFVLRSLLDSSSLSLLWLKIFRTAEREEEK